MPRNRTGLADGKVNIFKLAKIMGLDEVLVTQNRYGHFEDEAVDDAPRAVVRSWFGLRLCRRDPELEPSGLATSVSGPTMLAPASAAARRAHQSDRFALTETGRSPHQV